MKRIREPIEPKLLAIYLREIADGVDRLEVPIEIPKAVKDWLKTMLQMKRGMIINEM